ncbi:uncharacterized protein BT62DRAFT_971263 [Guyanagaster necrorhizus]|uniref:Phosphatidate phosphatase APP1 catalytic domain-containing protein n=1 Tax=Guyanagaster necrorhizus TaxID=856835 RepID=A0A9P7VNM5_9AGAR|nr:uncharacterized protein BT62DRAFT_971263 [Guyanagaster necrorhizus MCA 3950]KAG7444523.1 hypothetical protein BT62DRAFT_971263 [Guyanagaster necrorhizus MCA 3950]
MSEEMPTSWKSLASTASNRLKGYIAQKDLRTRNINLQRRLGVDTDNGQSWKEWAGQKISNKLLQNSSPGIEKLALFPGWAVRKYLSDNENEGPFEVDVYVSGFASIHRSQESASRSEKAFMSLAKSFASLPKLDSEGGAEGSLGRASASTEELLGTIKLPPRPQEITEEFEVEALERQFRRLNESQSSVDITHSPSRSSSSYDTPPLADYESTTKLSGDLRKFHANLEARLQPFWSSVLPGRMVNICLFPKPLNAADDPTSNSPLASQDVSTAADGSFQMRFTIRWEDMCQHPGALHIAFGERNVEHELIAAARLLPPPSPSASLVVDLVVPEPVSPIIIARIPLTYSPIRVISDIDDTIKHSDVPGGARSVFRNVFVKDLDDLVIPGMGEWYTGMWKKGVRFHYVSNGPFELLPVLGDFFNVAHLPPGSIKLKSYAGRSLFSGLLSAPAARKRNAVLEILDSFSHSHFILIGDTGEQDMELYAEFASQRPKQVLAVFIRHAHNGEPLEDPTGSHPTRDIEFRSAPPAYGSESGTMRASRRTSSGAFSATYAVRTPTTSRKDSSRPNNDYFAYPLTDEPDSIAEKESSGLFFTSNSRMPSTPPRLMEAEKKKLELQMRIYSARAMIPKHIPFRVFRSPEDCVEIHQILS